MQSTLCSATCVRCRCSVLSYSSSRDGWLWQVTQRSRGTAPLLPSGLAWHRVHCIPYRPTSAWLKVRDSYLMILSGTWWQRVQRAVPVSEVWSLK